MSSTAIQNISHNKYYNWLIRNLFSSWVNTLLTIIALIFIYQVGSFCLNWAIFAADFRYNFQGELITDRGFAQRISCLENMEPVGLLFMLVGISLCMAFTPLKKHGE